MTDRFNKVCTVIGLVLLAQIGSRPTEVQTIQQPAAPKGYPFAINPAYKVFEVEPDAKQINDILSQYGQEGAFQLAAAPIVKTAAGDKVILILVQHW